MGWLDRLFGSLAAPSPVALREEQRMAALVGQALAESQTDDGFEASFRRLLHAPSGLAEETAWTQFSRHLWEFHRVGEEEPLTRVMARRYLDDLPNRYGLKESAP